MYRTFGNIVFLLVLARGDDAGAGSEAMGVDAVVNGAGFSASLDELVGTGHEDSAGLESMGRLLDAR